jgi:hypothetical protein
MAKIQDKLKVSDLYKSKTELRKKIEFFQKTMIKEFWEPMMKRFIKEHVSYRVGQVIEITKVLKKGNGRVNRLVVCGFQHQWAEKHLLIRALGYFIDEQGNPIQAGATQYLYVYGANTSGTAHKLSENQKVNNRKKFKMI